MNSNRIRTAFWTFALLAAAPAHAQLDMVTGLFEEVNAVTVFLQRGAMSNAGRVTGDDLDGAGLEVLIDLVSGGTTELELGLGASFLRGYGDSDPFLDFRASVRALPTVSLYASREVGPLEGYLGASFGLVDLWNAQAYDDSGRAWSIEAQTFEVGTAVGAYWTSPNRLGVFAEAGYRNRKFPSATWTLPEGASLSEEWRSFDLSGYYLQAGLQLRVNREEDENDAITPPAPAGVWTLERVNGAAVPVTLDSADGGKRQLVHAVLRLEPQDSTYTLDMHFNRATAAGAAPIRSDPERGRYAKAEEAGADTRQHILAFTPDGDGGARTAERLAGRLYLKWNGHVLTFAPGNAPPSQ